MFRRTAVLCMVVGLTTVACGSSKGTATTTTPASTTPPTSTLPSTSSTPATTTPTSQPATTVTPTTVAPTTVAPTTGPPTTVCAPFGSTSPQQSADPLLMSSLYGADIRTGGHDCFERVVIELQGSGSFPGYVVEYQNDPIVLGESNETAFIKGDATIVVRMSAWMQTMEGQGYKGPIDFFPTNVSHILELRMVENFEGMMRWAIGIDHHRPFRVTVLSGPPRLVVDIATTTG